MKKPIHEARSRIDRAGRRELLIVPPLDNDAAEIMWSSLVHYVHQAAKHTSGYVNFPRCITDTDCGEATSYIVVGGVSITTFQQLGRHAQDMLNQYPDGKLESVLHVERVVVNQQYL